MKKLILFVITLIGLSITELLLCNYTIENPDKFNTNVELDLLYAFENQSSIEFIEGCFRILPDPNHRRKKSFNNGTPLLISLGHQRSDWQDKIVPWLISRGSDANITDNENATPLIVISERGSGLYVSNTPETRFEILQLLLAHKADVNKTDKYGESALMRASWFGEEKSLALLLQAGADASLKNNKGKTALDMAKHKNNARIVKLLTK